MWPPHSSQHSNRASVLALPTGIDESLPILAQPGPTAIRRGPHYGLRRSQPITSADTTPRQRLSRRIWAIPTRSSWRSPRYSSRTLAGVSAPIVTLHPVRAHRRPPMHRLATHRTRKHPTTVLRPVPTPVRTEPLPRRPGHKTRRTLVTLAIHQRSSRRIAANYKQRPTSGNDQQDRVSGGRGYWKQCRGRHRGVSGGHPPPLCGW